MRINVFEGGRRIALLLAALTSAFVIWLASSYEPYLSYKYNIDLPGATPVHTMAGCPSTGRSEWFSWDTPSGHSVSIDVCLLSSSFGDDGTQLVPFRKEKNGMYWGAPAYSDDVNTYADSIEASFSLPASELARIERDVSRRYWKHMRETLGGLAIGLGIFWVLVWAIGWVVRGFAGVPDGRDERAPKSAD